MSIANLIVHEVQKNAGSDKAVLVARPTENAVDAQAEVLAEQVGSLFNRSGMNTGQFSNPNGSETGAKLPKLLTQFYGENGFNDFAAFSRHVLLILLLALAMLKRQRVGFCGSTITNCMIPISFLLCC